ncbi:MAG: IgGFc-binding protein, partial [Bacteroidales bacterium]|nr:IgGFc-binding protein [Bacteroidales bacterium]
IWGDGDPSNGAPPGVPSDIINAGTVFILNNPVYTTNMVAIKYDGRDKIAATKTIAISRAGWASGINTLLSDANEVFDTSSWGKNFVVPIGTNIPANVQYQTFEYTGLSIMAAENGTVVKIDRDANGTFETTVTLNEGQAHLVNGGVRLGARVETTKPVQIELVTGDIGESYECNFMRLLSTDLWSSSYYTPVSTPSSAQGTSGTDTTVWLYNPGTSSLTVRYQTRTGNNGNTLSTTSLTVPGGTRGGYLKQVIPNGYGAHFYTDNGTPFYAISVTDSTSSQNNGSGGNRTWDWGFSLIPEELLTPQVLIGLGIGRDPTSATKPNENGNPVWVTPVGNGNTPVTIYIDYDADPTTGANTDSFGNKYDTTIQLRELDRGLVYDPNDRDQTGMLLYVLEPNVKLAAAWGQDPLVASAAAPGLDMGTAIPPLPMFSASKKSHLVSDNDEDGFTSPGDEIQYIITINNISRVPVPDILLIDNLPADIDYVPSTTYFTDEHNVTSLIPDDLIGTIFPLDGSGLVLNPVTALPV